MVSRRAIISRSRDDKDHHLGITRKYFRREDQWFSKEKLYKDHIAEVLERWEHIDDEIWAKVIVLERNKRVAKVYARTSAVTVNGSQEGFDGLILGLNGFANPLRDHKVTEFKTQIGTGCKLKMDSSGNILVKRHGTSNIYIKNMAEETAVSNDILKLPNGLLEIDKAFKLFDMKKFQQNINREMKRKIPERTKLEAQCISTIAFVKNEGEVLDSPIWIMIINIVALEMLGAKMPKITEEINSPGVEFSFNTPQIKKQPNSASSDEDPYSLTTSGSSGSFQKRILDRSRVTWGSNNIGESENYGPQNWITSTSGFDDDLFEDRKKDDMPEKGNNSGRSRSRTTKKSGRKQNDDPYYCGLRARVPTFTNEKITSDRSVTRDIVRPRHQLPSPQHRLLPNPSDDWLESQIYQDNGLGDLSSDVLAHTSVLPSFLPAPGALDSQQLSNGGMAFRTQELSSFRNDQGGKKNRNLKGYFSSNVRTSIFRQDWK